MVLAFKKYFIQANPKNASWFQEQGGMSIEEKIKRVDTMTLFFSVVSFKLLVMGMWKNIQIASKMKILDMTIPLEQEI